MLHEWSVELKNFPLAFNYRTSSHAYPRFLTNHIIDIRLTWLVINASEAADLYVPKKTC